MNTWSLRKLYNVRNLSESYGQMNKTLHPIIDLDIYSYPKIQTDMGQGLST